MSVRNMLGQAICGMLVLIGSEARTDGAEAEQRVPNIVLIMADDLGIEGVGCYGGLSYQTPHLDRLAATGLRFSHAYAQPLCANTRLQLMTGLHNESKLDLFRDTRSEVQDDRPFSSGCGLQDVHRGKVAASKL